MAFSKGKMATSPVDDSYGKGKGVFDDSRGGSVQMARMGTLDELMGKTGTSGNKNVAVPGPVDRRKGSLNDVMGFDNFKGFPITKKAQGGQSPLAQGGNILDIMGFRGSNGKKTGK